jgi:hypothetical protein
VHLTSSGHRVHAGMVHIVALSVTVSSVMVSRHLDVAFDRSFAAIDPSLESHDARFGATDGPQGTHTHLDGATDRR